MTTEFPQPNILIALRKWACVKQQEENYFTEILIFLLRQLLANEPDLGAKLLSELTDVAEIELCNNARLIKIQAQYMCDAGRPDIDIQWPGHHYFVEIKVKAIPDEEQIKRYQGELRNQSPDIVSGVTILSHRHAPFDCATDVPVTRKRWSQIGDVLEILLQQASQPETRLWIGQYLGLIKEQGLMLERVTSEMVPGLLAWNHLCEIIVRAAEKCKLNLGAWRGAYDYWGYTAKDNSFYIGGDWCDPHQIYFATHELAIQGKVGDQVDNGTVQTYKGATGDRRWIRFLDLTDQDGAFFKLSKDEQLNCINAFLSECVATMNKIKA